MKKFRIIAVMVLCIGLLFSSTSCVVLAPEGHQKHPKHEKHQNYDKHYNDPQHHNNPDHNKPKGEHKK